MNTNKKKILAIVLVLVVLLLGGASIYVATQLSSRQAVAPTAPESKPKASSTTIVSCGSYTQCMETQASGSVSCTTEPDSPNGQVQVWCCPAGKVISGNACIDVEADDWNEDTAAVCTKQGVAKECEPDGNLICNPDCPTTCGLAASTINCVDSCGATKTKSCPATNTCPTVSMNLVKYAYKNDSRNTAGNYFLEEEISSVVKGQTFVYKLVYSNTGTSAVTGVVITDTLTGENQDQLTFIDASAGCTYDSAVRKVSCNVGNVAVGATGYKAFRVKVSDSVTNGMVIKNVGILTYEGKSVEAKKDLVVEVTANPTATSTSAPAVTTVAPTKTLTATPTVLPETGIFDLPGVAAFGGGLILAVVGILLAL